VNGEQKLTVFKFYVVFACVALTTICFCGYGLYRIASTELQQQLIVQAMFTNTVIAIVTGVITGFLAYSDASKADYEMILQENERLS
jgi:hypothetical protein